MNSILTQPDAKESKKSAFPCPSTRPHPHSHPHPHPHSRLQLPLPLPALRPPRQSRATPPRTHTPHCSRDGFGSANMSAPNDCCARACPGDCGQPFGRGACNTLTGECDCASGWQGEDCTEAACPADCSSHGECDLALGRWPHPTTPRHNAPHHAAPRHPTIPRMISISSPIPTLYNFIKFHSIPSNRHHPPHPIMAVCQVRVCLWMGWGRLRNGDMRWRLQCEGCVRRWWLPLHTGFHRRAM